MTTNIVLREKMKTTLLYLGRYSPVLVGIIDTCLKYKKFHLVFIETGSKKSFISKKLGVTHKYIGNEVFPSKAIEYFTNQFDMIHCLSSSYQYAEILNKISKNNPKIIPLNPNDECLSILQNKEKMTNIAIEAGLPVLENITSPSLSNLPFVIRPTLEKKATFKASVIKNLNELNAYVNEQTIAQPFIYGPNLVVHVVKSSGRLRCVFFETIRKFEGVTLSLKIVNDSQYPAIMTSMKIFLDKIDFDGIGHFEFIVDSNNMNCYFLEFNGRFGGTSLKALALGYDEFLTLALSRNLIKKDDIQKKNTTTNSIVSNPFAIIKNIFLLLKNKNTDLDFPKEKKTLAITNLLKLLVISKYEFSVSSFIMRVSYYVNFIKRKL